ncbi:MAG: PA14 domain-containing protein, partial [Planctomycetota bacterium]|nr:PA14 domain-containing protein [Planctomycetota bacterium]
MRLGAPASRRQRALFIVCTAAMMLVIRGVAGENDVGTGLKGEYFSDVALKNLKFTRVDPKVDFVWTSTPPDKAMARTNYAVRWTGAVKPRFSEVYTFYTFADDAAILWVNGELLIDAWDRRWGAEDRATIELQAGKKYDIRLEYFQGQGAALARLLWSSASEAKEIIPQRQLFPVGTPPPERVRLAAAIPVFPVPLELPALEKKEDWPRALAALEAAGLPRSWLLLGPRPDTGFKLFDHRRPFDADSSDDWTLVPRDEAGRPLAVTLWNRPPEEDGADGYVDLSQILARDNRALAFGRTDVDWPVAGPALLWLTVDGRCAVYLNNEKAFMHERGQTLPGPPCLPLSMKLGRNVLKLRVGQHTGAFGFCARLERNDPLYRIALLEHLLELYPDDAAGPRGMAARLEIARRYEQLDRPREALAAYRKALALFGENDEVLAAADEAARRLKERNAAGGGGSS